MRKRKHIAKVLAFVLAAGMITTPINSIGNVAVASADESSETAKRDMDKFTASLTYGADGDWNSYPIEIAKDGEYTFTHTVTKDNDKILQLSVGTDLTAESLNDNFKFDVESVTLNDTTYKVDTSATWNLSDKGVYEYTIINGWGNLNSTRDEENNQITSVKTGDKITVKINITGMNNNLEEPEATKKPSEDNDKAGMDKFTASLTYGADGDWNSYPTEITKDGEYTFTHTVIKDNDKILQLSVGTDLTAESLNDN